MVPESKTTTMPNTGRNLFHPCRVELVIILALESFGRFFVSCKQDSKKLFYFITTYSVYQTVGIGRAYPAELPDSSILYYNVRKYHSA